MEYVAAAGIEDAGRANLPSKNPPERRPILLKRIQITCASRYAKAVMNRCPSEHGPVEW